MTIVSVTSMVNFFKNQFFKLIEKITGNKNVNTIGDNKNVNTIADDKNVNTIADDKNVNTIGDNKNVNTIGDNKNVNTIGDNKNVNTIAVETTDKKTSDGMRIAISRGKKRMWFNEICSKTLNGYRHETDVGLKTKSGAKEFYAHEHKTSEVNRRAVSSEKTLEAKSVDERSVNGVIQKVTSYSDENSSRTEFEREFRSRGTAYGDIVSSTLMSQGQNDVGYCLRANTSNGEKIEYGICFLKNKNKIHYTISLICDSQFAVDELKFEGDTTKNICVEDVMKDSLENFYTGQYFVNEANKNLMQLCLPNEIKGISLPEQK